MDVINLPILPATTPLKDALRALWIQQRSALICEGPAQLDLINIRKIFGALGQQKTELSDVTIREPVYRPSPAEISSRNLDTKDPRQTWAEWRSLLKSVTTSYVLIDSYFGSALIGTLNEGLTSAIAQRPGGCCCVGPDEHLIPGEATIVPVHNCSVCFHDVICG